MAELTFESHAVFTHTSFDLSSATSNRLPHLKVANLAKGDNAIILDCGCGEGQDSVVMAAMGNWVIGVDLSLRGTKTALNIRNLHSLDLDFVNCDLELLPFRESSIDICTSFWALHHFRTLRTAARQMHKVLKGGGRIVILDPNGLNPVFRLSEKIENPLRFWLVKSGVDTPNEYLHDGRTYVSALLSCGFRNAQVREWFGGGKPPIGGSKLLTLLTNLRFLLFLLVWRLLPRNYKGTDLIIEAFK